MTTEELKKEAREVPKGNSAYCTQCHTTLDAKDHAFCLTCTAEFKSKTINKATLAGIEQGKSEVIDSVSKYVRDSDTPKLIELAVLAERKRCAERAHDLIYYTQHERDCILSAGSAGRPTKDGGYETKYAGKWYQSRPVDKTPKCTCGLAEAIATVIEKDTD